MFTALLNRMKKDEKGFTLIELLVVILIIGILAAIALPTFLGQKDKGKDASAKSDARNAVTQLESCLVDDPYATCIAKDEVKQNGVTFSATGSSTAFTVTKKSESSDGTNFVITKDTTTAPGAYSRSCDQPGKGSCPSNGKW